MNTDELMLGDLVMIDRPSKVISISIDGIYFEDVVGEGVSSSDKIKPIPITEEFLVKNGFGYIEQDETITHYYLGEPQFCADMNLHIGSDNKGLFLVNTFYCTVQGVRYVHELQHALRMCGYKTPLTYE